MLYLLAKALEFEGVFNLVRYLSFRTGAAVATALFLGLLIGPKFIGRSEEHTSELQSLMRISYAVFCLKKKKEKKQHIITEHQPNLLQKITTYDHFYDTNTTSCT